MIDILERTPSAPPAPLSGGRTAVDDETAQMARTWVITRRNVAPKRLVGPAPGADQLQQLFEMAAAAPDHGQLVPWRFIIVPAEQRHRLAEAFALALLDRDPGASAEQIEAARDKAHRAPLLMVAIARLGPVPAGISEAERLVALGACIQNMLLGAHAMGFGAGLTSGRAMGSARMAQLLGLLEVEMPVCCISIGTVGQSKARARPRPAPAEFVSILGAGRHPKDPALRL